MGGGRRHPERQGYCSPPSLPPGASQHRRMDRKVLARKGGGLPTEMLHGGPCTRHIPPLHVLLQPHLWASPLFQGHLVLSLRPLLIRCLPGGFSMAQTPPPPWAFLTLLTPPLPSGPPSPKAPSAPWWEISALYILSHGLSWTLFQATLPNKNRTARPAGATNLLSATVPSELSWGLLAHNISTASSQRTRAFPKESSVDSLTT